MPDDLPIRRCLTCDDPIDYLPTPRCPECGREFKPDEWDTYRFATEPSPFLDCILIIGAVTAWGACPIASFFSRFNTLALACLASNILALTTVSVAIIRLETAYGQRARLLRSTIIMSAVYLAIELLLVLAVLTNWTARYMLGRLEGSF